MSLDDLVLACYLRHGHFLIKPRGEEPRVQRALAKDLVQVRNRPLMLRRALLWERRLTPGQDLLCLWGDGDDRGSVVVGNMLVLPCAALTPLLPLLPSFLHSLTPALTHSFTPSLLHSLIPSLPHSCTHSFTHSHTPAHKHDGNLENEASRAEDKLGKRQPGHECHIVLKLRLARSRR